MRFLYRQQTTKNRGSASVITTTNINRYQKPQLSPDTKMVSDAALLSLEKMKKRKAATVPKRPCVKKKRPIIIPLMLWGD